MDEIMPLNISVLTRRTSSCRNSCWTRTTKPTSHRRYNSTTTYRCSSVYPNSIPTSKYICPSRRKRNSSHSKISRKALRLPAKWVLLRTRGHCSSNLSFVYSHKCYNALQGESLIAVFYPSFYSGHPQKLVS